MHLGVITYYRCRSARLSPLFSGGFLALTTVLWLLLRAGVGKTTLLTRLGNGDIRGFPTHLKCLYVKHEILSELGESVVGFMREVTKEDGVCV